MKTRPQLENELKHYQETIIAIEEAFNERRINSDKDSVIPEWHADRIEMLLNGA